MGDITLGERVLVLEGRILVLEGRVKELGKAVLGKVEVGEVRMRELRRERDAWKKMHGKVKERG